MRVALLTSPAPRHRALAARIASLPGVELVAVVAQRKTGTRNRGWALKALREQPARLASKVAQRLLLSSAMAELELEEQARFGAATGWPASATLLEVTDINGADVAALLRAQAPELVCVSGTTIVKEPIFALRPPKGLLNLHTGISPYYKGGPNCTLWCLARGEPQFIGATLHELDPGIDSGRLIITAHTPLNASDNHASAAWKTVALGAELYARVLERLAAGGSYKTLDQKELGEGHTYMTRDWNALELWRATSFVSGGGLRRWVLAGRPGIERVRLFNGLE